MDTGGEAKKRRGGGGFGPAGLAPGKNIVEKKMNEEGQRTVSPTKKTAKLRLRRLPVDAKIQHRRTAKKKRPHLCLEEYGEGFWGSGRG